ncbi:MAG: hypothetical protein WCW31_01420 [Patescibacteria group bacterium]
MPDAPSAPNPIKNFVDAKNPTEAIRILQNSGLNKDQLYEIRRNLNLDAIAPNDFLLADNAWNAAEALKKMEPNDFRKFKMQFGRRFRESAKTGTSDQPVEKNLGAALGAAMGFAPRAKEEKIKRGEDKKITSPKDQPQATQTSAEPIGTNEPETSTTVRNAPTVRPVEQSFAPTPATTPAPVARPVQASQPSAQTPSPTPVPASQSFTPPPPPSSPAQPAQRPAQTSTPGSTQTSVRPLTPSQTTGERGLGNIQATSKRRVEQPGAQGGEVQANISTRQTQKITPAQVTPQKIITQTSQTKIPGQQAGSIGAAFAAPTIQQTRKTQREAFKSPEIRGTRAQTPGEMGQQLDGSQGPVGDAGLANGEERMANGGPESTPPPARRMPPGTPFNIKPGSVLPIERMVNLGAQQYRARRKAGPSDQRAQVMGEHGLGTSTPVLLDSQNPLGASAYSSGPDLDLETKDGGGAMESDLEAIQKMNANQQQARRAQRMSLGEETGIPGMDEGYEAPEYEETPAYTTAEEIEEAEEAEETLEPGETQGARGDFEKLAAWTMAQQMQLRRRQNQDQQKVSMQTHIHNVQKMQKNLQMIWRMINAAELLSSEAVYPALLWLVTANLQMINKYTFQVKWIPRTEVYEDAAYLFLDFLILGAILLILTVLVILIALVAVMISGAISPLL